MKFLNLVEIAKYVHFTCFTWQYGRFRQWYPKVHLTDEIKDDQTGNYLLQNGFDILSLRVHHIEPTAFNYMNVYLY